MRVRKDHTMEFPMPVQPEPKYTWQGKLKCRLFGHKLPLRPLYDRFDPTILYMCERCGR